MSDIIHIIDGLIIVLGVVSTLASIHYGIYFSRLNAPLASSFSTLCFVGTTVCVSTLIFSATSYFGIYGEIHPALIAALRINIFGGLLWGYWYLFTKVRKLTNG